MNESKQETLSWPQAFAYAFAIVAILASSILMADELAGTEKTRTTVNSFFSEQGREQLAPDTVSRDDRGPLLRTAPRDKSALRSSKTGGLSGIQSTPNTDFWIFDANVQLFADNDLDGYFAGIDLLFDADTIYSSADVYAVIYLSYEGEDWVEYAETADFVINGTSGGDEYVVVSDLVSGYPTGSYDILIELFDAFDGSFVADFGPAQTSALAFLPLEDAGRDAPFIAPQPVVVNHGGGGGGATDLWTLAILAFVAAGAGALRRRRLPV